MAFYNWLKKWLRRRRFSRALRTNQTRINVFKKMSKKAKTKSPNGNCLRGLTIVGDIVLKQNIREQQRKGGKMAPDMLGPFTVTAIKGNT